MLRKTWIWDQTDDCRRQGILLVLACVFVVFRSVPGGVDGLSAVINSKVLSTVCC